VFLVLVARFALAIVLDAAAFIVWDLGTRAPLDLLADLRRAVASRHGLVAGTARFVGGAALLLLGAFVAGPALLNRRTFTVLETATLVAALLVEQLIGPDVRRRR
jgi:hypothetical protein